MAGVERVTVILPNDLVRAIDRREKNRSKFVAEAVRNELDRRRRAELRRSLHNPHPESAGARRTGTRGMEARLARGRYRRARGPQRRPARSVGRGRGLGGGARVKVGRAVA